MKKLRTKGSIYNSYSRKAAALVKKGKINEAIKELEEGKNVAKKRGDTVYVKSFQEKINELKR